MAMWIRAGVCALVVTACIGKSTASRPSRAAETPPPSDVPADPTPGSVPTPPPDAGTPLPPAPPVTHGSWTYYGTDQALSADIQDASPDEGGNVYVAGAEALFVKRRGDEAFLRFDASNAGLTRNCNDVADYHNETPAKPFYQCRILSVGGASPGKAVIGFDGFATEQLDGAQWTYVAGGADVVAFDPVAGTLARTRHVYLASPPHVICTSPPLEGRVATCGNPDDYWWVTGRRLFHRVRRIVVNHDTSSPMYGDAWMAGEHSTFSALLNNAAQRGLRDHTAGMGPEWADAKDTWEHLHPAIIAPDGTFVNGENWALSIHPSTGIPWGSNQFRTAFVTGYGPDLSNDDWWMGPNPTNEQYLDVWPDPPNTFFTATDDNVMSMSHCADGTLWIGSSTHGLARLAPDGSLSYLSIPDLATFKNDVSAVACDPVDASVWIGLGEGGVMRLRNGAFELVDNTGAPPFAYQSPQSIQIDRWASHRIVYVAFKAMRTWTVGGDPNGQIVRPGGIGVYDGP